MTFIFSIDNLARYMDCRSRHGAQGYWTGFTAAGIQGVICSEGFEWPRLPDCIEFDSDTRFAVVCALKSSMPGFIHRTNPRSCMSGMAWSYASTGQHGHHQASGKQESLPSR